MVFNNDEDFEQYVLKPGYVFYESEVSPGMLYYDVDYTDQYNKDIEAGVKYCIDCEDSKIRKRNCIARRMVMANVENILPFLMDELKMMYPKAEIVNYKKAKDDINSAAENTLSVITRTKIGKLKIKPLTKEELAKLKPIDDDRPTDANGKININPLTMEDLAGIKPIDDD